MSPIEFRKSLGLTQMELAKRLGYKSASYVSDLESGVKSPSFSLARAYFRLSNGEVNLLATSKS